VERDTEESPMKLKNPNEQCGIKERKCLPQRMRIAVLT